MKTDFTDIQNSLKSAHALNLQELCKDFKAHFPGHVFSFTALRQFGEARKLDPLAIALIFQASAMERSDLQRSRIKRGLFGPVTVVEILNRERDALKKVSLRSSQLGRKGGHKLKVLDGHWARRLKKSPLLGPYGDALIHAIATQEYCAAGGLVRADPTCGAAGVIPGLQAALFASNIDLELLVAMSLISGLIGAVAFSRGPVSGAQSGCAGEVGVAVSEAAGGLAWLNGGGWSEVEAAAALGGAVYTGLECSPTGGFVEMPCVPRNGFGSLWAFTAVEAASAGLVTDLKIDSVLDRIFGIGGELPTSLRETESKLWASQWSSRPHGAKLLSDLVKLGSVASILQKIDCFPEFCLANPPSTHGPTSLLGVAGEAALNVMKELKEGKDGPRAFLETLIPTVAGSLGKTKAEIENAFKVAALIGELAANRGSVGGSGLGWGSEVGVTAAQGAAATAWLMSGDWPEIDAAAALATVSFVTIDASTVFKGQTPFRYGFAVICAMSAATMALDGLVGNAMPHDFDDCLDRLFGVSRSVLFNELPTFPV